VFNRFCRNFLVRYDAAACRAALSGPSDALQARTRARPQTFNYNGFILDDFKSENADASTSNKSKQDPKEERPRLLPLK
jgi:hypothetical protein